MLHPAVLILVGAVIGVLGFTGIQQHRVKYPRGWRDQRTVDVETDFNHSISTRYYVIAVGGIVLVVGGVLQLVF